MARRPAPHRGIDTAPADPDRPSKTALKAQSSSLQSLGHELAGLPPERLARVELPDALREAILTWQRTRSHEGRRRQMQYIGKLMRQVDDAPLREALAAAHLGPAREAMQLHEAERWRDALIGDDEAIGRWLARHPGSDVQRLRSLVRAARRDRAQADRPTRHARSYRELFQFIRPHLAEAGPDQPSTLDDSQRASP